MNIIYTLDVTGKYYHISNKILNKIPYLSKYINTEYDGKTIFVERSNIIFDHVLAYVIDERYPFPKEYYYELDFYGVNYGNNSNNNNNNNID
jgi:hypothetical protein